MAKEAIDTDWTAVIARSLGFLCIHQADLQDETLVKQADFLQRFGIPRSEAAIILGSSPASLGVMDRREKARETGSTPRKRGAKKTTGKSR